MQTPDCIPCTGSSNCTDEPGEPELKLTQKLKLLQTAALNSVLPHFKSEYYCSFSVVLALSNTSECTAIFAQIKSAYDYLSFVLNFVHI